MLGWVGSRCWIRIKAMPVPLGSAPSNLRKASRPPAEAPSPTTGKLSGASDESDLGEDCRLGPERAAPARCGPCPGTAMDPRRSASSKDGFWEPICDTSKPHWRAEVSLSPVL